MAIASIVHLYVFPAKPYELMGDLFKGSVSVLGDYASVEPLDPDEVWHSERPTKLRLAQPDPDAKSGMTIGESFQDVVFGGGGYLRDDVMFTVTQAVEPVEKGITQFNKKLHKISQNIKKNEKEKITRDDGCIVPSSAAQREIRGIDDPLLNGSVSDSGISKSKKHRRRKGFNSSTESGGESSSDQNYGEYQIRGHRWVMKE